MWLKYGSHAGAIGQGVEKVVDFTFAGLETYDVATRMVALVIMPSAIREVSKLAVLFAG